MTPSEIIEALRPYTGEFPTLAVREAVQQREAVTPLLLAALESVAADPAAAAKRTADEMLHHFALYLLAQFREKRAYRLILQTVSGPDESAFHLYADILSESLHRILASVFDGDLAPLQSVVENPGVDEFVRSAALETFISLTRNDLIPRETTIEYWRSLLQGRLPRVHGQIWDSLGSAIADLPAPELLDLLRQADAEGLLDPDFASIDDLTVAANDPDRHFERDYSLVTDTEADLSTWAAFSDDEEDFEGMDESDELGDSHGGPLGLNAAPAPVSAPYRAPEKPGRNDPCHCGSGKKYKKCCLGKDEA